MNSEIIELGNGKPVIGVVGLCHENERSGRVVLDNLATNLKPIIGRVKLIYANRIAEEVNKRKLDSDLNRVFPEDKLGNLEERTAFSLAPHLAECDYVLDIHSTSYPTEPFAISTIDSEAFDSLSSF